jgi:hypothetical protein
VSKDHVEWCRHMHRIIAQGGIWGLPRSGLVFRKTGNVLLWVGTIPPATRIPPALLDEAREHEFEENFKNFSKAGVAMWRANVIRHFDSIDDAQRHYNVEGEVLTADAMMQKASEILR